ncbi:MAG: TRAP-type C4-dicarboxylate transport system permease small subunit [Oleiphilaceae bacterium]|jgi:TRAP-type C4-dicarboxylate transport system permease small subunit
MSGNISIDRAIDNSQKPIFLKVVSFLSTISGWFSAAMTLLAIGITCQMIFVRFVLNGSTVWQTEAVVFLIIAATVIGLPFVQQMKGHVNVKLIPLMMPLWARFYLFIFTTVMSIVMIAVMFWFSYEYWHLAFTRGWTSDTVWAPSLWIVYSSLPIGFGLLILQLIADLTAVILKIESPFDLGEE